MNAEKIEIIARAIKNCTDKFHDPVDCYIETEAQHRWEEKHPDGDWYKTQESMDELASYKIIAEAVEKAL